MKVLRNTRSEITVCPNCSSILELDKNDIKIFNGEESFFYYVCCVCDRNIKINQIKIKEEWLKELTSILEEC